jgi:hypothetical protein
MIRSVSVLVGGVVVLMAAQVAFAFLTPPAAAPAGNLVLLALLSNTLTVAMLLILARRMDGSAARRALLLWTIWGGIQANSFAELLIFDIGIPVSQTVRLVVFGLLVAAAAAAFVGWAATRRVGDAAAGTVVARPAWLALAPPLYIVCYFVAGMAVWPFIADYYLHQAHPMPALPQVLGLQVFRGLAFGAIVLVIVQACDGTRGARASLAGVTLAVLGGVAPLVMPNPLMPTAIRMAHLIEVTPSIFIFGAVLAWTLTRPRRARASGRLATQS